MKTSEFRTKRKQANEANAREGEDAIKDYLEEQEEDGTDTPTDNDD